MGKTSLLSEFERQFEIAPNVETYTSAEEIIPQSQLKLTKTILPKLRELVQGKHLDDSDPELDLLENKPLPAEESFQPFSVIWVTNQRSPLFDANGLLVL